MLEKFRVVGRSTIAASSSAAVDILLQHRARVVATPWRLQFAWALRGDVGCAARTPAACFPSLSVCRHRHEVHGHVEAVDEGDVKEIHSSHSSDGELGKRDGLLTAACAGQHATAVSCLA